MTNVSTYTNVKGSVHIGDFSLDTIYKNIVSNQNMHLIKELRSLDRSNPRFDEIKEDLPIFTPHATFKVGQKGDKQFKSFSGFVYIDLDCDNCQDDADKLIARPECIMAFKSVSNRGYGILMSICTDELTYDVFKSVVKDYIESLGVKYDPNALGLSRGCIISSDENAYYNKNAVKLKLNVKKQKVFIKSVNFPKGKGINPVNEHFSIRFQTQLSAEEFAGRDMVVIPEGRGFVKTHLNGIENGNRHTKLRILACGIVFNNPLISYEALLVWMRNVNIQLRKVCTVLPDNEIVALVAWVHKKHISGQLDYKPSRFKKVWFSDSCTLTAKEKQSIARKEIAKLQSNNTQQKIYDAIEVLQMRPGKITQNNVVVELGMSKMTVRRYWNEFKEYVKEINDEKKIQ